MALLVKADGTREEVAGAGPDGRVTWEQIKEAIGGGMVEHIDTDPAKAEGYAHMWFDEEGKMKSFPENPEATKLSAWTAACDVLVGDVLLCTEEDNLGE
ncbi:MAG: DUF3846 domain-containing protein [Planctomycetota bacterium]|jgi:hypothetical protein